MIRLLPILYSLILFNIGFSSKINYSKTCIVQEFDQVENATKRCSDIIIENVFVPGGKTLKLNLIDGSKVSFRGNTTFGFKHWYGPLVTINGTGITVRGEKDSILDGQGQLYWDGQGGWSNEKPQFFTIQVFGGSIFEDIFVINTPKDAVQVTNSDNVIFSNWVIDDSAGDPGVAPKGYEGHNTDGFDVWNSTNVIIRNSEVYNQDDCVALRCGANITISNIFCHGSHGLSISVGFSNDSIPLNTLTNVTFSDSVVSNSRNGIHVKTHKDGGYGSISDVIYQNITLKDISYNGILIEENYSNNPPSVYYDNKPRNNVPIRNLELVGVSGTVQKNAVPVTIVCADNGCFDWIWSSVKVEGEKSNSCNFLPNGFNC